jgi:hypothetical protein
MDSGATYHVTGELEKMTICDKYHGGDQVHTTSGSGMRIDHVGHSTLHSPIRKIHLRNILHVPHATKNLLSINRLVRDNNAFLEFHPTHFFLKDQETRTTLLEGRCERGLYPLKPHLHQHFPSNKQVLGVFKPTVSMWHSRLGHPSNNVVQHVLSHHKLSFSRDQENNMICDACQRGKSHQLAYPKSNSVLAKPFELFFLMCGGQHQPLLGGMIIM